jgi:5'(3')-deoxyribonucleotidase
MFIDCDDTIFQSSKAIAQLYSRIYNVPLPDYQNNTDWNYNRICPLLKERNEYTVEDLYGMKEFFDHLELFPYAYEITKELTKKYELYLVSIGTMSNLQYKAEYIRHRLSFIDNVVLIYNKECKMSKAIVDCPEDSIFIDDVVSNLESVKSRHKFIYGEPKQWNTEGNQYKRLYNWIDVANQFLR